MQPNSNRILLVGRGRLARITVWQMAWAAVTSTTALAATGTWNSNISGNWTDASKWVGEIPNAPGDTANFTNNVTNFLAVSLSGDKTVGNLNIGDSASTYNAITIQAGTSATSTLIFDQSGTADATLTVPVAGGVAANVISSNILLKDNLAITADTPNKSTLQLTLSGPVNDDDAGLGVAKNGQGIIRFSAVNSFAGGLSVNGGRVDVNEVSALGRGPVTVASGAQVYLVGAGSGNNFTIAGTGYSNSSDAAAQSGAIRIGNNLAIVGDVNVQSAGARIGVSGSDVGFLTGNLSGGGDLGINGSTTTTGGILFLGGGASYTGNLQVTRGDFAFNDSLGGMLTVSPASGFSSTLVSGTSVASDVTLDSSAGLVTFRNAKGPLSIGGNLILAGISRVVPATFPVPGTSTLTVMSYASKAGNGSFSFDATGYRGTPAIFAGPNSVVITGLEGQTRTWNNASGNANWSMGSSLNWAEGDQLFYHADAVVFNDSSVGTVNLVGTVIPHSVTFNGTNHRVLAGTGTIDGAGGGIIKNGDAWLTLGGVNTFTGPVMVNAGRLIVGSTGGLGRTSGVHVAAGAVLDLNGKVVVTNDAWIAGSGDGLLPAITDSSTGFGGLRNVTLTAAASFGGPSGKDFTMGYNGAIDGAGYTLTKVGANEVRMLGIAKNLHTVVESGTLSGWGTDPFGSSLRIKPGATVKISKGGVYTSDVAFESTGSPNNLFSRLSLNASGDSLWTGQFTSNGSVRIFNSAPSTTMTIVRNFTVPGDLIIDGIATSSCVCLLGAVDVGDHVSLTGGYLALGKGGKGGSISSTVPIVMTGTSQLLINRSDSFTMPNVIAGSSGSVVKAGNGTLTLTADNPFNGTILAAGGTLLVNGNHLDPGSVLIYPGAVLGGKGTLPGAVTINAGATLAPGAPIGTFTVGSANLATTINGTMSVEYDGSVPQPIDLLAANGPLVLGATSALAISGVGSPLVGALHVIVTTTARSGTFANVSGVPAGYELVYTNTAIYLIENTYKSWMGSYYPANSDLAIVSPGADPDGDQLDNMSENLLGTDPTVFSSGLEKVSASSGSLTFCHSRADAPLLYFTGTYEWSLDLANWHAPGATAAGLTVNIASSVLQDNPSPSADIIQVVASASGGTAPNVFIRHKATSP